MAATSNESTAATIITSTAAGLLELCGKEINTCLHTGNNTHQQQHVCDGGGGVKDKEPPIVLYVPNVNAFNILM